MARDSALVLTSTLSIDRGVTFVNR